MALVSTALLGTSLPFPFHRSLPCHGKRAEDVKKRWKEYTELYKKDLNEPDNHDGVVSCPKPDILEGEAKWALGSTAVNKASGCDGIPGELFKTLKDDFIQVLNSICQQIWKTHQWPQDWKRSILIPIPKKGSTKECANHRTITPSTTLGTERPCCSIH